MYALVLLIIYALVPSTAQAQTAVAVLPDYNHSALFGVVVTDNGDIYAAGSNSTLLRSSDGGAVWDQMPMGEFRMHIYRLVTDGQDLFILAYPQIFEGRKELWPDGYTSLLFRFDTEQMAMKQVPFPMFDREQGEQLYDFRYFDVAATPSALYLSYAGSRSRLLRSLDGGLGWTDLAFADSLGRNDRCSFVTYGSTDDIIVYRKNGASPEFYLSTDLGDTWQRRLGPALNGPPFAYLGNGRLFVQSSETGACMISDTSGEWKVTGYPPFSNASTIERSQNGTLIVCSTDGGVFQSENEGITWATLRNEQRSGWSDHYRFSSTFYGTNAFIAVNTHGNIIFTTDGGLTWEEPRYRADLFQYAQMADAFHGYVAVRDDDNTTNRLMLTEDGFQTLKSFPRYPLSRPFMRTATLWYAVGWNRSHADSMFCRSTDGGGSWELLFQNPQYSVFPTEIVADNPYYYALATSGGLFFTDDRGESWSHVLKADWDADSRPKKILIPSDPGLPVWLLSGGENAGAAYSIIRSDPSRRMWDTVRTIPDSLRWKPTDMIGKTTGFDDIAMLSDGSVYATWYQDVADRTWDNIHVLYSDDNGASWQEWMTRASVPEQLSSGNPLGNRSVLFPTGGLLTSTRNLGLTHIIPMAVLVSHDGMGSVEMVLERAVTDNLDGFYSITYADASTAYLITGMAIYRITLPNVTDAQTPKPPPLPMSISTPYPHPVPGRIGTATLYIQSEHSMQVRMTVHDLAGREVGHLFEGELGPEGRYVSWSIGILVPGTYLLQLESNEGVCRRKVCVE